MMKKMSRKPPGSGDQSLLRQYFAPTGVGVILGAIATLASVLPGFLDRSQKLLDQGRRLALIEADVAAYSKVVSGFYKLLTQDQLQSLFPSDAKTLLERTARSADDEDNWSSVELKQSPEGAFFLWCEGGFDSKTNGAFYGTWLTRGQAIRWAQQHAGGVEEYQRVFSVDDLKLASKGADIGLCHGAPWE
jgi:hypothetical protein